MADIEFRTAYAAFLRSWIGVEFFDHGEGEKDFEDAVDQLVNQGGPTTRMFRSFHAKHGRYPAFEEICSPVGPTIGIVPDI